MVQRNEKQGILGINLTRRGWNNVLIYVILAIALLFWKVFPVHEDADTTNAPTAVADESEVKNEAESVLESDAAANATALFPDVAIVELATPVLRLEQSDQGWLYNDQVVADQAGAEHLIERWQTLQVSVTEQQPQGVAKEIMVRLADGRPLIVLALYEQPVPIIQLPGDDTRYRAHQITYSQLTGANLSLPDPN
ncbi:hypothetical protein SAMN06297229_0294 [Pseudidiomarina planktonica]|uniref:DUF4340 domain-containing protein n=1 Tax=Pseudidiomarina planktonica TaxID=1323738 RepID=A0A1Y6EAP9_9GAMM|nr:hypothetical protein [Pseudidiomarina planktonica]RUO66215.1 hypothetical protein CWI77_07285 [Pseudidiomarina planktonica]SMQ59635.1 hypothetical protein SAMN06297229_0294 [Pseudidiomarina planktonica]